MYQYNAGDVKNPGLELMLVMYRALVFILVVVVAGGAGVAAGLPSFVSGTLAGVFVLVLFGSRPFFEVVQYTCPHCGNRIKTIKNFGSYRCSNCGGESRI